MKIFFYRYIYKKTILIGLFLFLTTCSSTSFIYTFVNKYIQDEITFFLNLDKEEEVLLSQKVSDMVEWHRTSMLPNYAVFLNKMADKLEEGKYGEADIFLLLTDGRSLIEETVVGLTPYASKFLVEHQMIEDIEFIEKKMLMRRQERIMELSKSKDILFEDRLKKLTSNFERFFGDLNNSQMSLLKSHTNLTLNESRIRLHNRTVRQKVFIRFLKTQPTELELTIYLEKLLLRGYLITNPSYKAFSEISLERFQKLLVNMLAISSEEQRNKIIKKLRDYAKDFKAVSE